MAEGKTEQASRKNETVKKRVPTPVETALLGLEPMALPPGIQQMAMGNPPPVLRKKDVLAINRAAGARATNRIVQAKLRADSARRLAVQRQGDPPSSSSTGTWNMPLELGPVSDRGAARAGLGVVIGDLTELETEMAIAGVTPINDPVPELRTKQSAMTGSDLLTQQEAEELNALTTRVDITHKFLVMQFRQKLLDGLSQLLTQPSTSWAEEKLMDALAKESHKAFISGEGEDKIGPIKDALGKVKEYGETTKDVVDKAKQVSAAVKLVTVTAKLKDIKEKISGANELVGKVLKVADTASKIATVAGFNQEKAGAMNQSINQLRNGVALAGTAMSLAKGVPILGTYWSEYVVPMTDLALKGLEKLTEIGEKIGLESVLDEPPGPGGAPTIPPLQMQYFPGGQAMLDFMFVLVNGGSPSMTSSVKNYFNKFRKQFDAGNDEKMPDEPSMLNPLNWFFDDNSLFEWVQRNQNMIWAQLYGSLPHSLKR